MAKKDDNNIENELQEIKDKMESYDSRINIIKIIIASIILCTFLLGIFYFKEFGELCIFVLVIIFTLAISLFFL